MTLGPESEPMWGSEQAESEKGDLTKRLEAEERVLAGEKSLEQEEAEKKEALEFIEETTKKEDPTGYYQKNKIKRAMLIGNLRGSARNRGEDFLERVIANLPEDLKKSHERLYPKEKEPKAERKKLFTLAKEKLNTWWQAKRAGWQQKRVERFGKKYYQAYQKQWLSPEAHPSAGL